MAIRIFVGTCANNEDLESQVVLEHCLRKYAANPNDIEIEWMMLSRDPSSFWYGWNNQNWATPFSAFRFGVPHRCNFEGRAIYMDSDMIPRADFAELWNEDIPGDKVIVAKGDGRTCVTLFDCAKAKSIAMPIERLRGDPNAYRLQRSPYNAKTKPFATGNWNCLDGESYASLSDPQIKCIHYTAIPTQPQLKYALPRLAAEGGKHWYKGTPHPHWRKDIQDLFDVEYNEAIGNGQFDKCADYRVVPYGSYGQGSAGGGLLKSKSAADARRLIKQ